MTQLSIMIALLAALAIGNANPNSINHKSQDAVSANQVNITEPPQDEAGGGEGGWPAF